MSSPDSHEKESKGYSPHMRGVALGILVMGISLAAVIVLWVTIGYRGPDFSTQVMERQQEWLHEQYGLPPPPELSPEMLQVPPSLRSVAQGGEGAQTVAAGGGNQTTTAAGGGNQTTTAAGGGGGGGGATAGGSTINILEGASIQGSPDYDPDELTA